MSGVGFLATMKTFAPSIRRRRRCDKQNLELNNASGGGIDGNDSKDIILQLDSIPVTPITPPAAFLPPGYKRLSTLGKREHIHLYVSTLCTYALFYVVYICSKGNCMLCRCHRNR